MSHKKEIYTYEANWPIYGLNWSLQADPSKRCRLAVGSFLENYNNKIEIIQLNEEKGVFDKKATFDHSYPATKIMWTPDRFSQRDLMATTGDYLRLWEVNSGPSNKYEVKFINRFVSVRTQECAFFFFLFFLSALLIFHLSFIAKKKQKTEQKFRILCSSYLI